MAIAILENLQKTYLMGKVEVQALKSINLRFEEGEYTSIMGPSGSGKSTLLNLLGCLDRPTKGRYLLGDVDVSNLNDDELSEIRSKRLGFIFQSYNLIAQLSVMENIEIPLFYQGWSERESRERASELAEMVGLAQRLKHRPSELSGGEQQRVAVARALANKPLFLLADEPTGNLDSKTGEEIMKLLEQLNESSITILMVTHDPKVAARARRLIRLLDGNVVEDTRA